jgi:DNA-binding MurR/RpiR family transcriptional regulator
MGRRDILVVFDAHGYETEVVRFAEQTAKRGSTTIPFTDQWLSPVARVAKHILPVRTDIPSRWDWTAATLTLAEALIARTSERHWLDVKDRVETLEVLEEV